VDESGSEEPVHDPQHHGDGQDAGVCMNSTIKPD
jgi:hypothetical protein